MARAKRTIGHSHRAFLIAEAGVNHNGDLDLAHKLIDVAAKAGADAVKFQTFRAEDLVSPTARKAQYQSDTTGEGDQFSMLKALELPKEAWSELKSHCEEADILFMSTPFDEASCDLLVELGVDLLKLGSGDLTHRPLIEHCALTGIPLIMSTGMAERQECEAALSWFRLAFQRGTQAYPEPALAFENQGRVAMLHCVSSYPAPLESLNLRAIETMRDLLQIPIGFSDHSEGIEASVLAVAAGACIIEKHFTTDRELPGPDHRASLEPGELDELVKKVRRIETILGSGKKTPADIEQDVKEVARRSVVALQDIPKGTEIANSMVGIRRPSTGIQPAHLQQVLGTKALVEIKAGTPVTREMISYSEEAERPPQLS